MAQYHMLVYKPRSSEIWIYISGDCYREIVQEECSLHKKREPNSDFQIIRAKSGNPRDTSEALKRLNAQEPQWRDDRGCDQKTGKRGNRKGPRYL